MMEREEREDREDRERSRGGTRTVVVFAIAVLVGAGLVVALGTGMLRNGPDVASGPQQIASLGEPSETATAECNRRAEQAIRFGDPDPADAPAADAESLAGLEPPYRNSPAARAAYRDCMMGERGY